MTKDVDGTCVVLAAVLQLGADHGVRVLQRQRRAEAGVLFRVRSVQDVHLLPGVAVSVEDVDGTGVLGLRVVVPG